MPRSSAARASLLLAVLAFAGCGEPPHAGSAASTTSIATDPSPSPSQDIVTLTAPRDLSTTVGTVDPAVSTTFVTLPPAPTTTLDTTAMDRPAVTLGPPAFDGSLPAVRLRVGQTVAFVSGPYPTFLHEDGTAYQTTPPTAGDLGLLRPVRYTGHCPIDGTCIAWVAVGAGDTTIIGEGVSGIACQRDATSSTLGCGGYAAAQWLWSVTIESIPASRIITNADNGTTVNVPLGAVVSIILGTPAGAVGVFFNGVDNPANDRDATGWHTTALTKSNVLTAIGSPGPRLCQQSARECTAWRATSIGQTTLTFAGPSVCYTPCDPLHPVLVPLSFSVTIDVG